MTVKVKLFSNLKKFAPKASGRVFDIEVEDGATVDAVAVESSVSGNIKHIKERKEREFKAKKICEKSTESPFNLETGPLVRAGPPGELRPLRRACCSLCGTV